MWWFKDCEMGSDQFMGGESYMVGVVYFKTNSGCFYNMCSEYNNHFMSDTGCCQLCIRYMFFFNDTATTEFYTLSLHDALPISRMWWFKDCYLDCYQFL